MFTEKKGNGHGIEEMGTVSTKEAIKKSLYFIITNSFDEESRLAAEEMTREREKAINLIVEEQKATIHQIIENEKKLIWESVLSSKETTEVDPEIVRGILNQSLVIENPTTNTADKDVAPEESTHKAPATVQKVELEILPPRDQNEIATINTYLINMPELQRVELVNMVDKSIFKITMKQPVDFVARLGTLPQVMNASEVNENGQRKINITLLAKSKLERNNNLMNDKVNEIFGKRKR